MRRLFALTIVLPGIVLLVFGLRALDQERRAAGQQIHERLERSAELAGRAIDRQLAEWQQFREAGVTVRSDGAIRTIPPERVAYDLDRPAPRDPMDPILAEAERQEFTPGGPDGKRLAFTIKKSVQELWAIENFLPR